MATQASINSVYQIVKRQAAKDERGFISPADFNIYAPNAQQILFQEIFSEYRMYLANRKRYLNNWKGNYNSLEAIKDDLRPLQKDRESLSSSGSNNIFQFPSDYAYYIDVDYNGTPVTLVDTANRNYYANAFDAAPQTSGPIGVMRNGEIEILPTSITTNIFLSYYKVPQGVTTAGVASIQQPTFAYTTVSSKEVYNASNSIDFEFPKNLEYRLASIILELAGIELREDFLYQAAQNQQTENKQDANV